MGPLTAFIAWTVSSYACHQMAKLFLTNVGIVASHVTPVTTAAALTLVQIFFCWLLTTTTWETKTTDVDEDKTNLDLTNARLRANYRVALVMHVLSTFLTNWSLARTEAASTLAIKLMEPLVSALAQRVWHGEPLSYSVWVSLPLVIGGAVVFVSDDPLSVQHALSAGVVLAMGSNVLLAVRNLAIKGLHSGQLNLGPRRFSWSVGGVLVGMSVLVLTAVWWLEIVDIVSRRSTLAVTSLLLSGAFHVTYSLISTSVILRALDVVSHAMANVIKRVLVVALLYVSGSRSASGVNAVGLTVAAVGLAVYVRGKAEGRRKMCSKNTSMNRLKEVTCFHLPKSRFFVLITAMLSLLWYSADVNLSKQIRTVSCELKDRFVCNNHFSRDPQHTAVKDTSTQNETLSPFGLRWPPVPQNTSLLQEWGEFLSMDYIRHPFDTNRLASTLHTNDEVVWELQRLHVQVLTSLLAGRRHAMLMDFATYENKGDPAITAGQVAILKRLNVTIVFSCSTGLCNKKNLTKAREISKGYNSTSLIILLQGGGNLVGYPITDFSRKKILNLFPDFPTILFSQSIWLHNRTRSHLNKCREIYSHRENLTIFLRDRQSLGLAQKHFPGTKLMLMPDMAFGLGRVPRTMPPTHDILWIKRADGESSRYKVPEIPTNLSVYVGDWLKWTTNKGKTPMETSFLIAFNGLSFLQRGRVVITDRLHGHILSVLLGIPHVLIDNPPYFKLSSFRRSWTAGLSNTVLVTTGEEALDQAQKLLKKYNNYLPSIVPS
ncbi:hypothetical protein C0Q70_07240 [Pomacea canaliculata]|uniref:Sugar phosphate transporter domain-containing protein n=1 Tax=Pomacea canaliculata TaxID=400727 RepID=A0A2T7PEI2_POMCA|nr:uncharacterized protein LOC112563382 [Pomacea canaliculata]PVD31822.1 hypothetical protein C0Q70_07240 [Pomacea canaliculata]